MLNRLFIVIGVLAILAIMAAFIVPRFIQWGDYRDRMQVIASEVLGTPVEIVGDIEFSLLPQPKLNFGDVRVGAPEAPSITVAEVEAEFSLIDFLRDRYVITKLVLDRPSVELHVDESGRLRTTIALAEEVTTSNVSVASAEVRDGALTLTDARSAETITTTNLDGDLRMDALRGPFSFQGSGEYEARVYSGRIATSAIGDDEAGQLSMFVRPADEAFSITLEGTLVTGDAPSFSGAATYRQRPPAVTTEAETTDAGRGDLVLTSSVEATAERILLPEYTIVPDENRGATRLTGAAEIRLGAGHSFNAVISGGLLALPPRDATADQALEPYEFIRLLHEFPVPAQPGIPGTIGVDIAEINLRAVSLRTVRFDATADGTDWEIKNFAAVLPGNTRVALNGTLKSEAGRPDFAGTVDIRTDQLHGLAQLWRRPAEGNPLLNLPGALQANVSLVGETLSVSGALTIEEMEHPFSAEIGFEPATRHLNFRTDLGALDAERSAELEALLPDVGADNRFGVTFPKGKFDIAAAAATVAGLAGRELAAVGSWEGGVLALDTLSASDLGGIGFEAKLTAFGTVVVPEFSGTATIRAASADAPMLARLFDTVGTPAPFRDWFSGALPAELMFRLDAPTGEGGQGLGVTGQLGSADLKLDAQMGAGLVRALSGPLSIRVDLTSDDPTALTAQLGLGEVSLTPEIAPMHVVAVMEGTAVNSFATTVRIEGGGDSLGFAGNILAGDLDEVSGNGNIQATISDTSALTERLGAAGIWVPAVSGTARIDFDGLQQIKLQGISGSSGDATFTGDLAWAASPQGGEISGDVSISRSGPEALLALLGGPAATINTGSGFWPDGPLAVGDAPRTTTGRVGVTLPAIVVADQPLITDATFDLSWDATGTRLRGFKGTIGGGTATAELAVCCSGALPQKQVSGRLSLAGVDFGSIVPAPVASALSATLDGAAKFDGTGDSLYAALAAMTGEGTYTLGDLTVRGFDPSAFDAVETLDAVLEMEPDAVTALVAGRLDDAAFTAPSVSGSFTVAGGVLRSPNLAIDGEGARLFGSTIIGLGDLRLGGGFAMSPAVPRGPGGMLTEANAKIAANFAGTLVAPEVSFDVGGVVDPIMVEALEAEVARLEQLRAEEEARAREAAAERERLAAEERARLAAEEEARVRAEEAEAARLEAERVAAEEEARRQAEQAAKPQPQLQPGFNLNFQPAPPVNQF